MDYPKSVPNIGLVDGKFVDEDQLTGTPGSLIPSAWGNSVTDEVLNVIIASGQVPNEGDLTQLTVAIKNLVHASAGSMAGVRILAASASLTVADAGYVVVANIASGGVISLPSFASLYAGVRFYVQCGASSGSIVVNAPAGMAFGAPNASGSPTALTIRPGVAQEFIYISSSTILVTNGAGIAQLGTSGYELSANGKILQWVRVSSTGVTPNVFQTITLPIVAPNGVLCAVGSNCSVAQADTFAVNVIENTNSTIKVSWSATNGGAAGARIIIVCN